MYRFRVNAFNVDAVLLLNMTAHTLVMLHQFKIYTSGRASTRLIDCLYFFSAVSYLFMKTSFCSFNCNNQIKMIKFKKKVIDWYLIRIRKLFSQV